MTLYGLYYNFTTLYACSTDIGILYSMIDDRDMFEQEFYCVKAIDLFRAIEYQDKCILGNYRDETKPYTIHIISGKRKTIPEKYILEFIQIALIEILDNHSTNTVFTYEISEDCSIEIKFDLKNSLITKNDGLYTIRHYYNIINDKNGRYDIILDFNKVTNRNGLFVMKNKHGVDSIIIFCANKRVDRDTIESYNRPMFKLKDISNVAIDLDTFYSDGCAINL